MPECAFCESTELTKEHLFAAWIDKQLSPTWTSTYTDKNYNKRRWDSTELDFQTRVVCGNCNNTWMNEIETKLAGPLITPMMLGQTEIPLNNGMARSLAIFAFKTAIVADMSRRRGTPFFPRRIRHAFRTSFYIPRSIFMWMAEYAGLDSKISLEAGYLRGKHPSSYPSEHYVMTCTIGHFAFQILALKPVPPYSFRPARNFDDLAVPFWPELVEGFVWPAHRGLMGLEELHQFHHRWDTIERS